METLFCENGKCPLGRNCEVFNEKIDVCEIETQLQLTKALRKIVPTAFELAYELEWLQVFGVCDDLDDTIEKLKHLRKRSLDSSERKLNRYLEIYKEKTGKDWEW